VALLLKFKDDQGVVPAYIEWYRYGLMVG